MICLGCLSIFTAVLVARLHHQDSSQPVPRWLRRLIRLDPFASSIVSPSVDADKAEREEKITLKAERGGARLLRHEFQAWQRGKRLEWMHMLEEEKELP